MTGQRSVTQPVLGILSDRSRLRRKSPVSRLSPERILVLKQTSLKHAIVPEHACADDDRSSIGADSPVTAVTPVTARTTLCFAACSTGAVPVTVVTLPVTAARGGAP